jgi:hypothetical protein
MTPFLAFSRQIGWLNIEFKPDVYGMTNCGSSLRKLQHLFLVDDFHTQFARLI